MAKPTRELESKALKLSPRERARLAQRLISSLEREVDADAEKLWRQEAERRFGGIKAREGAGNPPEEGVRKARLLPSGEAIRFIPHGLTPARGFCLWLSPPAAAHARYVGP